MIGWAYVALSHAAENLDNIYRVILGTITIGAVVVAVPWVLTHPRKPPVR